MFSDRPSVPLSVRASVRPSVIHVVVLCFRDISSICWQIFAKLLSLVHLGTQMTWLCFWSKGQSSRSHHRGGGAQHSTLPSSATFSSCHLFFLQLDVTEITRPVKTFLLHSPKVPCVPDVRGGTYPASFKSGRKKQKKWEENHPACLLFDVRS